MKRRIVLFLILAFALVAGGFYYYKKNLRPRQLEKNNWDIYLAAGKWQAQINDRQATTIIGDSHIIELDFGQINRRPVQGIAHRGATSLLLKNLADTISILHSELSIVMVGTNDVLFGIDATLSSQRWDQFSSTLKMKQDSGIFVVNVPPLSVDFGLFTSPSRVKEEVVMYNKMLAQKAQVSGIKLIDLHMHMLASGEPASYLESDGIHLNGHGYKMLVTLINEAIQD
jgi:lysophospholipase L1-like esterase